MRCTLNGLVNPSLLTFTDIPNIVRVTEDISGNYSQITLTFNSSPSPTGNSQYFITILDETIENVLDPSDASNRRFYISDPTSTAASVAYALMNCGSLVSDFAITYNGGQVFLVARNYGAKLNAARPVVTNLPTGSMGYTTYNGSVNSDLYGGKVICKVACDGNEVDIVKSWHGDSTSFDISPVIRTFSDYGSAHIYSIKLDKIGNNGKYGSLSTIASNAVTYGYESNGSSRFLPITNRILINEKDGKHYTYENVIPITVVTPNQSATVTWTALTSSYQSIATGSSSNTPAVNYMADINVNVPLNYFGRAYYIDIMFGSSKVRFDVIKPLKAAEGYHRVYWRNCYGGISFFDFTGAESETLSNSIETYNENIYNTYVQKDINGLRHIYKNDVTKSYVLTSHLLPKDGKDWAEELSRSKCVWVEESDGRKNYAIPSQVSISEDDTANNVFSVQINLEIS